MSCIIRYSCRSGNENIHNEHQSELGLSTGLDASLADVVLEQGG